MIDGTWKIDGRGAAGKLTLTTTVGGAPLAHAKVLLALHRRAAAAGREPSRALGALATGRLARQAGLVARPLLHHTLRLLHHRDCLSEHPSQNSQKVSAKGVLAKGVLGVFWGVQEFCDHGVLEQ
jgi:hypothetical protein